MAGSSPSLFLSLILSGSPSSYDLKAASIPLTKNKVLKWAGIRTGSVHPCTRIAGAITTTLLIHASIAVNKTGGIYSLIYLAL